MFVLNIYQCYSNIYPPPLSSIFDFTEGGGILHGFSSKFFLTGFGSKNWSLASLAYNFTSVDSKKFIYMNIHNFKQGGGGDIT